MKISFLFLFRAISLIFLLFLFCEASLTAQFAQLRDDIYLADESSISVGLIELSTKKIKYKNQTNKIKTLDASEVLMIFNKAGEYLLYPNKTLTPQQADIYVKSSTLPPSDMLITVDRKIIPTKIISKNENEVIYENVDNPAGEQTISKDLLAAIIYKSGNHELLVSPSQAASILAAQAVTITNYRNGVPLPKQTFKEVADTKTIIPKNIDKANKPETETAVVQNSAASDNTAITSDGTKVVPDTRAVKSGDTEVKNEVLVKNSAKEPIEKKNIEDAPKNENKVAEKVSTPVLNSEASDKVKVSNDKKTNGVSVKEPVKEIASGTTEVKKENPVISTSNEQPVIKNEESASLPKIDFDLFSKKALEKTKDLGIYLSVISDKNSDFQQANKAIDQAVNLFVSEDARVEVSNNNGLDYKVRFKIREYLNRLKLLKYDKVEISWSNINYVSNFRKGPDGNYYGIISLQQRFNGLMEGRVVYSDVTKKNIEVVLKSYNKEVEGKSQELWDVLLSDIGIVVAKSN